MSSPKDKVLIVGAGIGGLALAQFLRKRNVPYEIFERDASHRSRQQGWAIALIECLPHLTEYLPSDLGNMYQTSVNAGIGEADYVAVVDIKTGAPHGVIGSPNLQTPGHFLRAGREHFRNFLWNHIPVSTGKHFSHYVEDDEGVTVYFKDGSSSRGSVLIGADGASSRVRAQLLGPGSEAQTSVFIPILGDCVLTREQYAPYAKLANSGFVAGDTDRRMAICRRSISPDGETSEYFFALCFRSDDTERDSAWLKNATKQELYDKCIEITKDLPAEMRQFFTYTGVEGITTPTFRLMEFVPPATMPKGRVTVLGDAAHAMTPFRGAGANTAVEDACDLAKLIAQRHEGQTQQSWESIVSEYSETMVQRGRKFVLASRKAGEDIQGTAALEGRVFNPAKTPNTESADGNLGNTSRTVTGHA